jgi:hypothetical protein
VDEIIMLAKKSKSDDFLVEVLGTCANLANPKYDWYMKYTMQNLTLEGLEL